MRRRVSKRVLLLEFAPGLLRLAEAVLSPEGVQLNHISRVNLPDEALDRGVPAEPAKMAGLLKELCREKGIPAHRVAVVLSPEAAFQRLVDLPAALTTQEAREYVLDPANGVQIPFPLGQTDFDLSPVTALPMLNRPAGMCLYMLSAVPQVLVDQVIEMLRIADLELQLLELGSCSQLRILTDEFIALPPQRVDLVLELLTDCSNLFFVTSSGLVGTDRLAAIRDFPEPELDDEQAAAALEAGLSAEGITIQDERYLPLTDLDLRVLTQDLKRAMQRFVEIFPGCEIQNLWLTGVNSAHPLLVDLLDAALSMTVQPQRPLLASGVTAFSPDQVLVHAGLARLVGLGLGLLPRSEFQAQNLDQEKPPVQEISVEQVMSMGESVVAPITSPLPTDLPASPEELITADFPPTPDLDALISPDQVIDAEFVDERSEEEDAKEEMSWPSIGLGGELGGMDQKEEEEEASLKVGEKEEEKEELSWPSIGLGDELGGMDQKEEEEEASVKGGEKDEETEEMSWPSLGLGGELGEMDQKEEEEETLVKGDEKEEKKEELSWPSISANIAETPASDAVIPGLPLSREAVGNGSGNDLDPDQAKETRNEETPPSSSSLGELRFADDADG